MIPEDLEAVLDEIVEPVDGRIRASASLYLEGEPKGPFFFHGIREDDANDTVPHQHRRDLRGLRVVAAWINHTDLRTANTLDMFVRRPGDPPGHGRLVHYLLDFSSTLGSAGRNFKLPRLGTEYKIDPPEIVLDVFTFGFRVKPWEDLKLSHPHVGFLSTLEFAPEEWVAEVPVPAFDLATERDLFWGAKLVASMRDEDLRSVIAAGGLSDQAAEALFDVLAARRDRIAATFLRPLRMFPGDRFEVVGDELVFVDLAVRSGVVPARRARYRWRSGGGAWQMTRGPQVPLPANGAGIVLDLSASPDGGRQWGPLARVVIDDGRVAEIRRESR